MKNNNNSYQQQLSITITLINVYAEKYVIIANCGDSRGVCCVSGKPALATQDHKVCLLTMISLKVKAETDYVESKSKNVI